jgi:tetratricopeptide (TPR) repeat protein/transcriptional regulator with XRE-family HTH domain
MAAVPSPTFGTLLKRHRLAAGLTQEELAAQAGLSPRGIADLERGARTQPRKETIHLLIEALHLSPQERVQLEAAARGRAAPPAPATASRPPPRPGVTLAAPLVGRIQELGLLERQLAEGPPVLLVVGEPGIGKSRLLQVDIERAEAQGWTVLAGSCHRRSGQEPYAPFIRALTDSLRHQTPAQQRLHLEGCTWLARLLPELAESNVLPVPAWSLPPEQARRLMFAAVARYLTNSAGPAGTLLVLDDLHWAGSDAIDLLQALVHTPTERPLRFLGAYRDTDLAASDPLAVLVADLTRERLASRLLLAPLAQEESTALLEALLPETAGAIGLRQQVLERAGGVPFFLISCVQALQTVQRDSTGAGAVSEVPWTVAETIRQRVAALPEAAQHLLGVAAVMGRTISSDVLLQGATRSGRGLEDLLEALEACCRVRLLAEVEGQEYQFAHDLVREVVLADLGTARRALLHRRVAEVLEHRPEGATLAVLAYHYAQSGEAEKAVLYLERAGDAARARYAHAEAAEAYREVVSRLDALGRTTQAAPVRAKWGDLLMRLGRYEEALVILQEAEAAFRLAGDLEGELRTLAQVGRIHRWRGTYAEGLARLLPRLKELPKLDASQGTVACSIALAYLYTGTGQYREQLEAAEQAATLARAVGDEPMLLVAQDRRCAALYMLGQLEEARAVLTTEVLPAASDAGQLGLLLDALTNLSAVYYSSGEYLQAQVSQERALELAERIGGHTHLAHLTFWHGLTAFYLGEWKQARDNFERGARLAALAGRSWNSAYPSYGLAHLALVEGQEEAHGALTEALAVAERSGDLRSCCTLQGVLAEDDLLAQRPEAARARLAPFLERISPELVNLKDALPLLAWAELEIGEVAQAQERLEEVIAMARQERMRPTLAVALRVQALAWSRQERWAEAEAALEEALALCHSMPNPYAEAKTLYVFGQLSQAKGKPEQARERFLSAQAILEKLGERPYARKVEQLLAMKGVEE